MNTDDKKKIIIQHLQSATYEQLIEDVYEVLYPDEEMRKIPVGNLAQELQNKISRALESYRSGRYITHGQMKQKVDPYFTNLHGLPI